MITTEFLGFSDPFSSMTHLLGAGVFLVMGMWLLYGHRDKPRYIAAMSVFIFAIIFTLSMSGVYHLLTPATTGRAVLQRLDHAGIFFLIAGTFTPVHGLLFRGLMRWGFLFLIWTIAITGITLKTIFFTDIPEWLGLIFYLGLGWMGALSGYLLFRKYGWHYLKPLVYGAIAYTVGAALDFIGHPVLISHVVGPHEIFHIAVIVGISMHWKFLVQIVEPELGKEAVSGPSSQSRTAAGTAETYVAR